MRISRLYTQATLKPHQTIQLDEKSSHYLSKVLRLTIDADLILFNGDGNEYSAVIQQIEKKVVVVQISGMSFTNKESPLTIHLGIAISKGDRMDWIIQKATELGITEITPLTSERSEVKLKAERLEKKLQHWRQIAISSCEQCGRNRLPVIHDLTNIHHWLDTISADKKFVLHHRSQQTLSATESVNSVALLIGPEGGLSDVEIQSAESKLFQPLRLGPRVLRTETAPLAAITLLQHVWGDM